ncbi:MAG: type II secretion system protein [Gemmiger sp.]|nr:type II secretion system protein [Gemmiger sp.]
MRRILPTLPTLPSLPALRARPAQPTRPTRKPGRGQGAPAAAPGATLVELMASMALFSVFAAAVVGVLAPCTAQLGRLRQCSQAQTVADTLMNDVRALLLHAQGPVRFCVAGQAPGEEACIFAAAPSGATYNAVEFLTPDGYLALLDAGILPETVLSPPGSTDAGATAPPAPPGRLHLRRYRPTAATATQLSYRYFADGRYVAAACTPLHQPAFYGGNTVLLEFAPLWQRGSPGDAKNLWVAAAAVTLTVQAAGGEILAIARAVLDFANRPLAATAPAGFAE